MKKGKRNYLITVGGSLIFLNLTAAMVSWTINQYSFFDKNEEEISLSYITASEETPAVRALSEQIGIELDPALEQHAALFARQDRLVVCPDTLVFTQAKEGWFRGSVDRHQSDLSGRTLPEDPVYLYTGTYADDSYIVHVALLDDQGLAPVADRGLEYELIVQLQPVSGLFPMGGHELVIRSAPTTTGRLFLPISKLSIYLRSSKGLWVERKREKSNLAFGSALPALVTSTASGHRLAKTDRIQYWCSPIYFDENASHYRIQPELYLDGELWASLSFWYPDDLYR